MLYLVIDEAHRVAPEIQRFFGEWSLEKLAREAGKYGIRLIIANQAFTKLHRPLIANMANIVIFKLNKRAELERTHRYFSGWSEKYGLSGEQLRQYVDGRIENLEPGEAFLIESAQTTKTKPVSVYWEYMPLKKIEARVKRLNVEKFKQAVKETKKPPTLSDEEFSRKVILARKLSKEDPEELLMKVRKGLLTESGYTVFKEIKIVDRGKITLPAQIVLKHLDVTLSK